VASLGVNTFPQAFLEVLHHLLQHVGRNCCHFFPDVLFQIHRCPWFLFVPLDLEIPSEEEGLRLGILVQINIEVPKNYPLSQERIVVFRNTSRQQKPDTLHTSAPWQLKCFESGQKGAQGQILHAKGCTHNCFAKSLGISAGPIYTVL
jgi:hypothetical protein